MKLLLAFCLITSLFIYLNGQDKNSEDISLLTPENAEYADAMVFADFLKQHGLKVISVHKSKLNGFFRGINKAAFYKTDKGVVEVIFFPGPAGAEAVTVIEDRKDERFIYSFVGQPDPNPPGDIFNSKRPMYFAMYRNWFIVSQADEIMKALDRDH